MTGNRHKILAFLPVFLAVLALPALAGGSLAVGSPAKGQVIELGSLLDKLKDQLSRPTDPEELKIKSAFLDRLNGVKLYVNAGIRGWMRPSAPPPAPPSVQDLMKASQKTVDKTKTVPPPDLAAAYNFAKTLESQDRVLFANLGPNTLGTYEYLKEKLGTVKLCADLSLMTMKVGTDFAFATVIHEAAHALDHMKGILSDSEVIAGEVSAFSKQYQWLKFVDPYGEKLSYLRANLAKELRRKKSELTAQALSYADNLAELFATDGKWEKLKAFALRLGYRDGAERRPDAPPSA